MTHTHSLLCKTRFPVPHLPPSTWSTGRCIPPQSYKLVTDSVVLIPGNFGIHSVISELDSSLYDHTTAPKIFHYPKSLLFSQPWGKQKCQTLQALLYSLTAGHKNNFFFLTTVPFLQQCQKHQIKHWSCFAQPGNCKQQQQTAATANATTQTYRVVPVFNTEHIQALNLILKSHNHVSGVDWQGYEKLCNHTTEDQAVGIHTYIQDNRDLRFLHQPARRCALQLDNGSWEALIPVTK